MTIHKSSDMHPYLQSGAGSPTMIDRLGGDAYVKNDLEVGNNIHATMALIGGVALKTTANVNWYVSTTGNDTTGDGTIGNPWLTRQRAYNQIPDVVAHKVTINLAAGTYYDAATLSGNFIIDGGSVTVQGAVTQQLAVQTATGGNANNNGQGEITKAGAGWGVNAYQNYWVRFITTTSPSASIIFKYVKILSNTADTIVTPILRFTPSAATTFDIVSFDTILSGATSGAPNTTNHVIERVSNMQTAVQSWADGLYYRNPVSYDALHMVNGKSYTMYISQANLLLAGVHFGVTDPAFYANAWHLYIVTAATYVNAFGIHMDGNSMALNVGAENAIIDASNVVIDYRTASGGGFTGGVWDDVALTLTKAGAFTGLSGTFTLNIFSGTNMVPGAYTATWVDNNTVTLVGTAGSANSADVIAYYGSFASQTGIMQTASGSSCYFKEYYILADALHYFPWMTFISGAGSNGYIDRGYVTNAINILNSRFGGYVDSGTTNGIYGSNNVNLYNVISNAYAKIRSQTNAGAANLYVVDDTARTHYYTNISTDNYVVSDIVKNQTGIVAATTLPVGYIKNSLTVTAPTTLTSTPTITAGVFNGQRMSLIGTSDANTVTLQDNDTLAGSTLELTKGTGTVTLGQGDKIDFIWNTATSKWEETGNIFANMKFKGATGSKGIYLTDNQADALSFQEGTNKYLTFVTTDSNEAISTNKTVTMGGDNVLLDLAVNSTTFAYQNNYGTINVNRLGAMTGVNLQTAIELNIVPQYTLTEPGGGGEIFNHIGANIDMSGIAVTAGAGVANLVALKLTANTDVDAGGKLALWTIGQNWMGDFPGLGVPPDPLATLHIATSTIGGSFRITGTDGGNVGVAIVGHHKSASPADGDAIFSVDFRGNDSGAVDTLYGQIVTEIQDPTNGSEESIMRFNVLDTAGAFREYLRLDGTDGIVSVVASKKLDASAAGIRTFKSVFNCANPPTAANLDDAFGSPTVVGSGFVGVLDDNDGGTDCYVCWTTGNAGEWFYATGTKAL